MFDMMECHSFIARGATPLNPRQFHNKGGDPLEPPIRSQTWASTVSLQQDLRPPSQLLSPLNTPRKKGFCIFNPVG
jgi:hypothetical protein